MMWRWRFRNAGGNQDEYDAKTAGWEQVDQGLDDRQLAGFYSLIKLRKLAPAHGYNVRFALQWTPVIVCLTDKKDNGHVVVVSGYDGQYSLVDPQASMTFETDGSATFGAVAGRRSRSDLDSLLGPQIFYW